MRVLLVHGAFVVMILGCLGRLYARPGHLRAVFAARRRPGALRVLHPLWALALVAILALGWWSRAISWQQLGPLQRALWAVQSLLELGVTAHWLGFVWHGWRSLDPAPLLRAPLATEAVTILLPCADESPAVLQRAIGSLAGTEGVVVVDNSRTAEGRRTSCRLSQRAGLRWLGLSNRGSKAAALNDALAHLPPTPLLAVFDADQLVDPRFLDETRAVLAADPGLAFVQTPQAYEDTRQGLVGRAAAQQEALQYDCVLESKDRLGWVRCCGTGFLMRRAALDDAGGFDERCVAEDLATGHRLHQLGWRSRYLRRPLAVGLAPESLDAYWRQQERWATASAQLLRRLLTQPGRGGWRLWAEGVWSSGFYLVALILPVLLLLPAVGVALGADSGTPTPLAGLPLYALVVALPYATMGLRGYAPRDLLLLQGLLVVTSPRYLRGVLLGLSGRSVPFRRTRGGHGRAALWPQVVVQAGLLVAGAAALARVPEHPDARALLLYGALLAYTVALGHRWLLLGYSPRLPSSTRTASGTLPASQPALRTRR